MPLTTLDGLGFAADPLDRLSYRRDDGDEVARLRARFVIKEKFFGREIRDIFGTSDYFRCERHEPYESWLLRFAKAGFVPYEPIAVPIELPAYCTADVSPGLVRLGYRDLALIAVFAYRSDGERAAPTAEGTSDE